jgi:histidyl-tRNA synthetase
LGEAALRECASLARQLRAENVAVELAAEGKLKRAMELANKLNARYALIVGENEIAAGEYALKNMRTGEQKNVRPQEIKASLAAN